MEVVYIHRSSLDSWHSPSLPIRRTTCKSNNHTAISHQLEVLHPRRSGLVSHCDHCGCAKYLARVIRCYAKFGVFIPPRLIGSGCTGATCFIYCSRVATAIMALGVTNLSPHQDSVVGGS